MAGTVIVAFKNFLWRFAERSGAQIIQFIVFILLARILEPEAFGTIALLMVFIAVLQVFINSGFGTALIQKKDTDDTDFSSVFYFNISMCIFLYVLMFFSAPFIASFYKDLSLIPLIRVLALLFIISGVRNIQQAYVSKNMLFKKFFFSTLGGTIISALIGVGMAYKGYGVWALVIQAVTKEAIDTLILWVTVDWRPKLLFSLERLKGLFSFGWKMLISGLIDTVYNNLRQLIIGKMYTRIDLAFYNKGNAIPNLVITNINSSISSILLPVMSKEQDNIEKVKNITRKSIQLSTYIIAPIMVGMGVTSYSFVPLLLTEKWLPCIPFLWVFCFTYTFYPIHTANLSAIQALGRSDLFLKLEIIKKAVGLIVLVSTMWYGVMVMAYSLLLVSVISQIINSWPNKKLLNYGYLQQLKDIMPNIVLALFAGFCMYLVSFLNLGLISTFITQIFVGYIVYVGISFILKIETFEYILNILMNLLKKKK